KVVNGHGRVGQDRWMPEAGAVHQRADPYSCGPHCQGRVTGDGLETITVGRNLGRIEVVPDADPIEAELFRAVPQVEQLADGAVLRARVNAELRHPALHPATSLAMLAYSSPPDIRT